MLGQSILRAAGAGAVAVGAVPWPGDDRGGEVLVGRMVTARFAGPGNVVAGGVQDDGEGDLVEVDGCGDGLVDEGVVDGE